MSNDATGDFWKDPDQKHFEIVENAWLHKKDLDTDNDLNRLNIDVCLTVDVEPRHENSDYKTDKEICAEVRALVLSRLVKGDFELGEIREEECT